MDKPNNCRHCFPVKCTAEQELADLKALVRDLFKAINPANATLDEYIEIEAKVKQAIKEE